MERTRSGNRIYPISTYVIFMQSETPRRKVAACSLSLAFPVSPQGARGIFLQRCGRRQRPARRLRLAWHLAGSARTLPSPTVRSRDRRLLGNRENALGHGPSALDNAVGSREIKSLAVFSAEAIEVRIAIKRRPTH